MSEPRHVIRLLGGPPGLADRTLDLSADPHDAADLVGDRFVRVARESLVMSFSGLQGRCCDRASAEHLAASWRLVTFQAVGGRLRSGPKRRYRYEGSAPLAAGRDEHGRWRLVTRSDAGRSMPLGEQAGDPHVWTALEAALDAAAARFATVAALLPDGPLAERALDTRREVGRCVADAARLCAVGAALADGSPEIPVLVGRAEALVTTIERATAHVVVLHLDAGRPGDPITPMASLTAAWAELAAPQL